ncbi:hypothetical protein [Pedobacter sp. MW01-1-1]|uniref:hypothetical protein n=1 Tax=Pedobacter sp. MW01-1-1 TaxID=3383027 RepID=UPI003FEEF130
MNSFFSGTSILSFLACVVLGVLYAWLLYGTNKNLEKKLRYSLILLRVLVVTLLSWLLVAPLVKTLNYTVDKPIIIIGQDNSLSVEQIKPANFNQEEYEKNLKALQAKLEEKYEVRTYHFGEKIGEGFNFTNSAKLTNAAAFIQKIKDEYVNRNVGGIVIASDGIFNRGGNPLYKLNDLKSTVYTIALGDTLPKRDLLISNINYNNIVYLDDDFTIELQAQAFQSAAENFAIRVAQNGAKVAELNSRIEGNNFVKNIPIKLHAGKVGVQKFTVQLSELKNEITTKNNSQTFYVEVIDGREKVLLAAAAPHPDLGVLKEAISLNKHYEASLVLGDELNTVNPAKYDLVILYQLPDYQNVSKNLLQKVLEMKKPVWYILGAQSNINAFNQIQNQVNLASATGSMQEVYPNLAAGFTSFNLQEDEVKSIPLLDPLLMPFGKLTVNTNVTSIFNQRIGKVNTEMPLLFFTTENGNKTGYLLGEGLWRWKLSEAENENQTGFVNSLIAKTVQYLAVKDDKRRFKVFASASAYDENERVQLNAMLYNESYQAVNDSEVKLALKNDAGKVFNYVFSKTENGYSLDAGTLPVGNYTYIANTVLGKDTFTAQGSFYVTALVAEFQQTTANHQLLNTMSQQSKGKMFMPSNLLRIADEMIQNESIKTIRYEDRKYDTLINMKWIFALLIILLSTEWFLRKRNGEV